MEIILLITCIALLFSRRFFSRQLVRLITRLGGSQETAVWIYSVITLPGILVHEIAHFLTAALFGLRTGKIEMLPVLEEDGGVELGSVQVERTDPFRFSVVGMAPLLFGIPLLLWLTSFIAPGVIGITLDPALLAHIWLTPSHIIPFYLLTTIALHMFPSRRDMSSWPIVGVILLLSIWLLSWLGIRMTGMVTFLLHLQSLLLPLIVGLVLALGVMLILLFIIQITLMIIGTSRPRVQ